MIKENKTPSMYGLIPPADSDEASARLTEIVAIGFEEAIIGVVFYNFDQLWKAFMECGIYFNVEKKWINTISTTCLAETILQDGSKYTLIISCLGDNARVLNCLKN